MAKGHARLPSTLWVPVVGLGASLWFAVWGCITVAEIGESCPEPPCALPPSCANGILDGDESGVDCGGSCPSCDGPSTCSNGVQDGDETGVDCGGSCPSCDAPSTCTNGVQDGDETGVDCGGSCPPCTTTDTDPDAECEPQEPPAEMRETIELTWKEMTGGFEGLTGARPVGASVMNFTNLIWDQVTATGGTLQYCIRWESAGTLTSDQREEIEDALERWANNWFRELDGYNCWPFDHVPVKVVGVAVSDRALADWDSTEMPVYVGDYFENAPQCPQTCGRFFNRDNDYSDCPGGTANHYDMSLWLTDGFANAVGGDWGQRMSPQSFMNNMAADSHGMWVHEFGHGLGFPDYYNWDVWAPGVAAPSCVMNAGAAWQVTPWDAAMLRYTWDQLKTRLLPP